MASRFRGAKELGPLCKRGHDHEGTGQSLRFISNRVCAICMRDFNNEHVESGRNKQRWNKRQENLFDRTMHNLHANKSRRGMPVSITRDYLVGIWNEQQGKCYWTGVPLDMSKGDRYNGRKLTAASVDRLNNDEGYVEGNVVWACAFANLGRQRTPPDEFRIFLKSITT